MIIEGKLTQPKGEPLTDAEQTNKDIYTQLIGRYKTDPASLPSFEKAALIMAYISEALATEAEIKRLTEEIYADFQNRCDRTKAFLDQVERGAPYEGPTLWDQFLKILPNRMYHDCWKIEGLEDILQQVYALNSRAVAISDRLYDHTQVDSRNRPPTTKESDPVRCAKLQRLNQLYAEEKQILEDKGMSGQKLEDKAWGLATFRMAVGDKAFDEMGCRDK